jgi:hypothetical protein
MRKAPLSAVPLLLVLLLSATGCTRYYWSKPGATAEQFTQDNQACLGQAAGALPAGAALEAVEQYYRACLGSRGYVRDKQVEPPPPGSYRGIERGEEFDAAVQAAGQTPRQGFEQQLAQLDDLKARGRITEDEYATMRKRLVDGVTPGALTPAPAVAATPPRTLAGRWYGGGSLGARHSRRRTRASVGVGAGDRSRDHTGVGHRVGQRGEGLARWSLHRRRRVRQLAAVVLPDLGRARAARHLNRLQQPAP